MKKSLLITLVSAATFFGCSKNDPDTIVLNPSEVTLKQDQTHQISVTSKSALTYEAENDFHAEVSPDGKVTAGYVGETNIVVKNAEDSKNLKVIIEPTTTLYKEPELDFKLTKSQLIAKLGTPDFTSKESESIIYSTNSKTNPLVLYIFDESLKLKGSAAIVDTDYSTELGIHLRERYNPIGSKDYTIFCINANTINKATMAVGVQLYDITSWLVMYIPYSASARQSNEFSKTAFSEYKKYFEQMNQ